VRKLQQTKSAPADDDEARRLITGGAAEPTEDFTSSCDSGLDGGAESSIPNGNAGHIQQRVTDQNEHGHSLITCVICRGYGRIRREYNDRVKPPPSDDEQLIVPSKSICSSCPCWNTEEDGNILVTCIACQGQGKVPQGYNELVKVEPRNKGGICCCLSKGQNKNEVCLVAVVIAIFFVLLYFAVTQLVTHTKSFGRG